MEYDAIGIGLCAWDIMLLFDRYPGPNQKTEVQKSVACGGGPVPTALTIFSKLGGKTAFLSAVGDRQEGLKIRCDLAGYGVDVSLMHIRPDRTSAKAYIWVDQQNGDRTIALDSGDVEPIKADELPDEIIENSPLLLMDGRHTEVCIAAAEICRKGGGEVIFDAGSPRAGIRELMSVTDHAVVSTDFVKGTFGDMQMPDALVEIQKMGPTNVVITEGETGGHWLSENETGTYDAFNVQAIDTTGAGDAFHGVYLYGLMRNWDIARRCKFASAVAAMVCRTLGGRTGAPTLEEAEIFIQQHEVAGHE
jgi:ribokinase